MEKHEPVSQPLPTLRLNLQSLADGYNDSFLEPSFCNRQSDKAKLLGAMVYYGQQELKEEYVYLGAAEVFRAHPIDNQDIDIVSIGDPGPWYESNPMLILPQPMDPALLLNLTNQIFQRYFTFDLQLHKALCTGGLSELAAAALTFFQNPLFVHDENWIMLCRPQYVSGMTDVDVDERTGVAMFKMDLINQFKNDQDYIKTLSVRGASLWIKNSRPYYTLYRVLYVNLFDEAGRYKGRICINEINSPLQPSHFRMLEHFAHFVSRAIARSPAPRKSEWTTFTAFLRKYLRGPEPPRETALRFLGFNKWQEHDAYLCAKVKVTERDITVNCVDNAVRTIALLFPRCCVFFEEGFIWITDDLTVEELTAEAFSAKLRHFAESGMFLAGVSDVFHSFFRVQSGFSQAAIALEYGHRRFPHQCFFSFLDHVNSFFMYCAAEKAAYTDLCQEKLLALLEADAEKGTEYFKTLRVYLENERNLSETAQALHVHRSTLQYRIDKIHETLALSLDDPNLRLYLLNCFHMLELLQ